MLKTLHILNGQGTAYPFQRSGLAGEVMVWNEALAVGPVVQEVGSNAFWKLRIDYHSTAYTELEKPPQVDYKKLVLSEFEKVQPLPSYQELVLWFEFDLFCQVNLIALCSWLHGQDLGEAVVSLVCIDRFPGIRDFKGMGQLSAEAFPKLFTQRKKLDKSTLLHSALVWSGYCDPDPRKIQEALTNKTGSSFPFLARAMQEHYQRFPSTFDGLNKQERQILNTATSGSYSKRELVGQMLQQDRWYGFGDLQYYIYLHRLKALLSFQNQVTVSGLGQEVLAGKKDFLEIQPEKVALGGAVNTDYRWDPLQQQLIKQP